MTLPKIGESFAAEIGSNSAVHVVVVDSNTNKVHHFDENGDPHMGMTFVLPPDYVDKLTNAMVNPPTDFGISVADRGETYADVFPLGAPFGWLVPFNSPQGVVHPYYDREGIVKLYRRVNDDWVSDASYRIGVGTPAQSAFEGTQLVARAVKNMHRFAGCYYNLPGQTPRFMYLVSDPQPQSATVLNFTGPRWTAYESANHTNIFSAAFKQIPQNVSGASTANLGIVSIQQIGIVSPDKVIFACTGYFYLYFDGTNINLSSFIGVPGAIQTSRDGLQNIAIPSTLFLQYNTTSGLFENVVQWILHNQLLPEQTGTAYGNYGFDHSEAVISFPINQQDMRTFYRTQASNGILTLHKGTYNLHEFDPDAPSTRAANTVNDEVVIRHTGSLSINSMKTMVYTAPEASKPIKINVKVERLVNDLSEVIFGDRNPFTSSSNLVRVRPGNVGFVALVGNEDVAHYEPNWLLRRNGVTYKPISIEQAQDNNNRVVFEQI